MIILRDWGGGLRFRDRNGNLSHRRFVSDGSEDFTDAKWLSFQRPAGRYGIWDGTSYVYRQGWWGDVGAVSGRGVGIRKEEIQAQVT